MRRVTAPARRGFPQKPGRLLIVRFGLRLVDGTAASEPNRGARRTTRTARGRRRQRGREPASHSFRTGALPLLLALLLLWMPPLPLQLRPPEPRRCGDSPVDDGSAEARLAPRRRRPRARFGGFPRLVRVVRRQVQKSRPRPNTRGPGARRLRRRYDIRQSREVRLPAQKASGSAGRHSGTTSVPSPPTSCDRPAHWKTRFCGASFSRRGGQPSKYLWLEVRP